MPTSSNEREKEKRVEVAALEFGETSKITVPGRGRKRRKRLRAKV